MCTTVRLDARLLAEARRYAAQSGRTLTSLIDEGLRDVLARRVAPKPAGPVTLPTGGSGGLQPGVGIDRFATLLDVMEGDESSEALSSASARLVRDTTIPCRSTRSR